MNSRIKENINFAEGLLPDVDDSLTAPFWEGTRNEEIRFPRCRKCHKFHFYPNILCPFCHSADIEWQTLTSQPTLFTWTCVRWNLAPEYLSHLFETRGHYIVGLVEFAEAPGFRLPTNITGCQPEDLKIGMQMEVVYQKVNDRVTVPTFKPKE